MGKLPEKEITVNISLIGDKLKLDGDNLAHINGRYLRMIERGLFKAIKTARVSLIHQEKKDLAKKQQDKIDADKKAAADKERAEDAGRKKEEEEAKKKAALLAKLKGNGKK